jgi:DNA ligase (NAD+)
MRGIGEVVGRAVHAWFADGENKETVKRLLTHLSLQKVTAPAHGPLQGQTVVVTGTLEGFSREEAEAAVRKAGGSVSRLSLEEDVLRGGRGECRLEEEKAKQLGVPVIGRSRVPEAPRFVIEYPHERARIILKT